MGILNFIKPDKIVLQKATEFEANFEFRPLEPGYGVTIGNALRRVLLNSLEGYAIVGINIAGADHEFATIKGITEDVTEIILNLKQVRLKRKVEGEVGTEKITLSIKNKTEFTAGMIGEATPSFEVMNPELLICTLDSSAKLDIEITVNSFPLFPGNITVNWRVSGNNIIKEGTLPLPQEIISTWGTDDSVVKNYVLQMLGLTEDVYVPPVQDNTEVTTEIV